MNAQDILMLYFISVMTARHAFHNVSHYQKYRYCRIRYAQNSCALSFDEKNVKVDLRNRDLARLCMRNTIDDIFKSFRSCQSF